MKSYFLLVLYGPGSDGTIGDAIVKRWDSISKFLEEFSKEATENFGSGWTWLAKQGNELAIVNTSVIEYSTYKGIVKSHFAKAGGV